MRAKIEKTLRGLAVPVDSVRPDPRNPRVHDRENLEKIKTSLRRYGQQKPIVADAAGVIIAGEGQWRAARELGWQKIAVAGSELKGQERTGYRIADNRTGESSQWDETVLMDQLCDLAQAGDDALEATGFSQADLLGGGGEGVDRIEDLELEASLPVAWILLAIPLSEFARAREHVVALEALADVKVEVSRNEQ